MSQRSCPQSYDTSVEASDTCASNDDFVFVQDETKLPLRSRILKSSDSLDLEIHPSRHGGNVLISIQPPTRPKEDTEHVSCDVVLVIDISTSMNDPAPLPDVVDVKEKEAAGLSILDLTKHAARTILETLNEGDRLGLVTFSTDAEVVQPLLCMTNANKKETLSRIENLRTEACTNLWSGIRAGLDLFQKHPLIGNVQGLYVLTDGMPNYMCPRQGYVAKLRPMFENAAATGNPLPCIHTFGFGYHIRSGLMQAIAEIGGGRYAFIPDAGMIGTVFVHAVSNLFTTFATSATLEIESDLQLVHRSGLEIVTGGLTTRSEPPVIQPRKMILHLGGLHYGQSRDITIGYKINGIKKMGTIKVKLTHRQLNGFVAGTEVQRSVSEFTDLPPQFLEYHRFRMQLCAFISDLFPLGENGERVEIATRMLPKARLALETLSKSIRSSAYCNDPQVKSLSEDIDGEGSNGQVSKALIQDMEQSYWTKWGRHYLRSLLHAHLGQVCNSFKDPGPLQYGKDSPLFVKCRDRLDEAFDTLPAPKPSILVDNNGQDLINVSMRRYNCRNNPCFEASSRVRLADNSTIEVSNLRPGTYVWTPWGPNQVAAVVKTQVYQAKLCRIGNLWITPWHPVKLADKWIFPSQVTNETKKLTGKIYSIMLNQSRYSDAHAIEIEGQVAVTLGHGILKATGDARAHPFFGNYGRVARNLMTLSKDARGVLKCSGMRRSAKTGLACGFMAANNTKRSMVKRTIFVAGSRRKVLIK